MASGVTKVKLFSWECVNCLGHHLLGWKRPNSYQTFVGFLGAFIKVSGKLKKTSDIQVCTCVMCRDSSTKWQQVSPV